MSNAILPVLPPHASTKERACASKDGVPLKRKTTDVDVPPPRRSKGRRERRAVTYNHVTRSLRALSIIRSPRCLVPPPAKEEITGFSPRGGGVGLIRFRRNGIFLAHLGDSPDPSRSTHPGPAAPVRWEDLQAQDRCGPSVRSRRMRRPASAAMNLASVSRERFCPARSFRAAHGPVRGTALGEPSRAPLPRADRPREWRESFARYM